MATTVKILEEVEFKNGDIMSVYSDKTNHSKVVVLDDPN